MWKIDKITTIQCWEKQNTSEHSKWLHNTEEQAEEEGRKGAVLLLCKRESVDVFCKD